MKTSSPLTFAFFLAVTLVPEARAQEPAADTAYVPPRDVAAHWEESGDETPSAPRPYLLAEARMAAALFDDFQFGGRGGLQSSGWTVPLGFFVDFEGRPYGKAVRVRESETLEYQFREHRFTFSPGVSASLPVDRRGGWWTFAAGVGLSFGDYRGSSRSAEAAFPVWFETGYRAMIGKYQYLGIAYQYFPLPDASPHRITVQWGLRARASNSRIQESP